MSINNAMLAIKHFRHTSNLDESLQIAQGKHIKEDIGQSSSHTEQWYVPDQDALNRFQLYLENQLNLYPTVSEYSNGAQSGYLVTVTGDFSENDIASISASLRAMRMDNLPGSLS
jgi:hypothetical protein